MGDPRKAVLDFLGSQGWCDAAGEPEAVLRAFQEEMDAGLAGRPGSLPMIPTFIEADRPVPPGKPVIVVDAGGSNLRVATVRFSAAGRATIENFSRHAMPGVEHELSGEAFFAELAGRVLPVAGGAEAIGFCFSYPAEMMPDGDGRLLRWTKQIKAPEVVGELLGARLAAELARHGHRKRIVLLNDTVATLLAGRGAGAARRYDSYVGFILGTGTNTAYVESNRRITKRGDLDPRGAQAINVESGSFAGCARSRMDEEFDAGTADPGSYMFEKMIAGAYLGGLSLAVLHAAARDGLFSAPAAAALCGLARLTTPEADAFLHNPFNGGPLLAANLGERDMELAYHCIEQVTQRAARLAAVNIAAAVLRCDGGSGPLHPVCVNADGSTFYKTYGFRAAVEQHLHALLDPRGRRFELVHVEDAPLIGAAVAGLARADG